MSATTFNITARDAGAWTNGIRLSIVQDATGDTELPISTGPVVGFKPWTATVKFAADKKVYTYRIKAGLLVSGPATSFITIEHATRIVGLHLGAGLVDEAAFEVVPTLRDVAAWIERHAGWTAKVVGQGWYPVTVMNELDQTLSATALFLPAEEGLLAYLLNISNPLVSAEISADPGALHALAEVSLTGGAGRGTDAITSDELNAALALAGTVDAHAIFVQSAAKALQVLAKDHCVAMSEPDERKYRIFFTGINFAGSSPVDGHDGVGATNEAAVAAAVLRATELDGPVVMAFDGPLAPNPVTGVAEQLGGLGLAAQAMGIWAGGRVSMPLTNKPVTAQSLEFSNLTRSEMEALLDAGVFFAQFNSNDGRTRIVQAVTTYQTTNLAFRNLQGLSIQHHINRLWIRVLSAYVGAPLDLETGSRIKADAAQALDLSILSGSNPDGFLTRGRLADGTELPAWEALTVVGDSTTGMWTLDVNAHPVGESDFIRVRTKLTPVPIEL